MKTDMRTDVIQLPPKRAREFVENAAPNRVTQPLRVALFEQIIDDGQWQLTHQGIAFDRDSRLVDGLHRCLAISRGRKTVPIMATWNLPDDALAAIDQGKTRDATDIVNLTANLEKPITKNQTAVAKAMWSGFTCSAQDRLMGPRLTSFIVQHFDPLMFVHRHAGAAPAMIKAPVARAFYTQDKARLQRFLEVYTLGVSDCPKDTAASLLALRYASEVKGNMSANKRAEWYRKTESALRAFLSNRKLKSLGEVAQELYPIPDPEF